MAFQHSRGPQRSFHPTPPHFTEGGHPGEGQSTRQGLPAPGLGSRSDPRADPLHDHQLFNSELHLVKRTVSVCHNCDLKQKFSRLTDTEDRLQWPGGEGGGMDWEFRVSKCKPVHTGWISNMVLLYSTGGYISYAGINHDGKEYRKYVYTYREYVQN